MFCVGERALLLGEKAGLNASWICREENMSDQAYIKYYELSRWV